MTITPQDQATIDDDEFVSLSCGNEERNPQILTGDVIYYPNWQCPPAGEAGSGEGKVVHYTKKAGTHTLKFQFGEQTEYAYNSTVTWDGSDSAVWTLDANWAGGVAPLSTDDVIIDGNGTYAPVISGNVTVNSLAIGQTTASTLSFTAGTAADLTVTGTLTVYVNGTITVTASDSDGTPTNGTGRTITAANIDIQTGGSLNANGLGFAAQAGPGVGSLSGGGGGGSYGGVGGVAPWYGNVGLSGSAYGTAASPVALGSGGVTTGGGAGGGAIKLSVSGTLTVNGTLSANSGNASGGNSSGGSGGSIWITGNCALVGTGTISTGGGNAGAADGGGGGGGRIDVSGITVATSTFFTNGGTISVVGGTGVSTGEIGKAGTVKFPANFDLVVDNSGATGLKNLTLGVNVESGSVDETLYNFNSVTVKANSTLTLSGNPQIVNGGSAGNPYGQGVTITATNMTITGTLSANNQGFKGVSGGHNESGTGPGKGGYASTGAGAGGGYGGAGGDSTYNGVTGIGGTTYGTFTSSTALGSGGGELGSFATPGGSGGGAIKLSVSGTLTVNGTLSATSTNASGGNSGGGSGGSIYLDVGTLAGSGTISANGGNAPAADGGGGGGGRVAIYYITSYSITPTATGGTGNGTNSQNGAAGTVFFSKVSGSPKKVTGAATPSDPTSWYREDGWLYRKKITIDNTNVDSDLTNFPLYVFVEGTGSGSSLASKIQDSGQDLRFTDSSGVRTLPHEIESYSEASGNVTAYVWVKVPTVSGSTDTAIYMYYGNSSASDGQDAANVWDTNYKGVWHSKNATTTTISDSTVNANTGTKLAVGEPVETTGKIDKAQDYDGSNDYISIGNIGSTTAYTYSFWAKRGTITNNYAVAIGGTNSYNDALWAYENGNIGFGNASGSWSTWSAGWTDKTSFHHVVVVVTATGSSTPRLYFDTVDKGTISVATTGTLDGLKIGEFASPYGFEWIGTIDEVRISSTARSADWIKFEYNNANEADNELSWGSEGTSSFTRTRGGIRAK